MKTPTWTLLLLGMVFAGCDGGAEPPAAPTGAAEPPPVQPPDALLLEVQAAEEAQALAEASAKKVGSALRARLTEALQAGDLAGAAAACADEAQGMTALATAGSRGRAGRSSLRLRNPVNTGPDWVQAWLQAQGERPAEGASGFSTTQRDGEVVVGRFVAPIAVEAPCLTCHGPAEAIPAEVQAILAARYPEDKATGYQVGDLRGALWAEARVPVPATAPAAP